MVFILIIIALAIGTFSMRNNKNIFSLVNAILVTSFVCSIVEAFTYTGFIAKHFDLRIGFGILFIFVITFFIFRKFYKSIFFKKLLIISAYLLTAAYLLFDTLEKVNYGNFVFSHFHLNVYLLLSCAIIMSVIFLINSDKNKTSKYIYSVLGVILIQYLVTDIVGVTKSNIGFMIKNPKATYDQKMEVAIEKKPYDFAMFIKSNTPENVTILIPPQGYPWPQTSNTAYFRYFLYPRNLVNGGERESKVDLKTIDYVLIDYGETTISEHGFTNIWPKFDVKGEYIVYWDSETGETTTDNMGIYKYNESDKSEKWGLIKLKH